MPVDVLKLPPALLPLGDTIDLLMGLSCDVDRVHELMSSSLLVALCSALKRADPGIQRMTASAVQNVQITHGVAGASTLPLALKISVVYADPLTQADARRRHWVLVRALLAP